MDEQSNQQISESVTAAALHSPPENNRLVKLEEAIRSSSLTFDSSDCNASDRTIKRFDNNLDIPDEVTGTGCN